MVCLLRLAAIKTELFCYILLILLLLSVFVFLSLIELYFLLFSRSPNSYKVELYILVLIARRQNWILFCKKTLRPHLKRLVGFLDCWSYFFWTMTSRRPITRSYSGNGRSGSQNGEDVSSASGRSESRNYLSNVRPENR